jgi:hypothetical protein
MGHPQDENGVKNIFFFRKMLMIEYAENKDVLAVEDNVGH